MDYIPSRYEAWCDRHELKIGRLTVFPTGWQRFRVIRSRNPGGHLWGTSVQLPFVEIDWEHFDPFNPPPGKRWR
jgi:hypothetical protein